MGILPGCDELRNIGETRPLGRTVEPPRRKEREGGAKSEKQTAKGTKEKPQRGDTMITQPLRKGDEEAHYG